MVDAIQPQHQEEGKQSTPKRRWLQFSLRHLLILTVFVGLIISHLMTSLRLREADQEIAKLRAETARLGEIDPEKVNIVSVPSLDPLVWKWRIFLPRGASFRIRQAFEDIPVTGLPPSSGAYVSAWSPETPEEGILVTVQMARNVKGDFDLWFEEGRGASTMDTGLRVASTLGTVDGETFEEWRSKAPSTIREGGGETVVIDPSETIVLLRSRPSKRSESGAWTRDPDPTPGIMLWLEPVSE